MSGKKNPTREWVADLLAAFAGQENTLTIPRPYITLTGSVEAALLLSQIIYWSDRTKMADGWFAKTYAEWTKELALSKYQVTRSVKLLSEAGVETDVRKFKGAPTVHYRFNREVFSQWIVKKLDDPKFKNLTNESEETDQSFTETTTETTTERVARKRAQRPVARGITVEAKRALVEAWVAAMKYDGAGLGVDYASDRRMKAAARMLRWDTPPTPEEIKDYTTFRRREKPDYEFVWLEDDLPKHRQERAKRAARVIPLHDETPAPVIGILEARRNERIR